MAASSLCQPLIEGPRQPLFVAHLGTLAWQLRSSSGRVVASLQQRDALLLPHALVMAALPTIPPPVSVGDGALWLADRPHPVARWWRPSRPRTPELNRSRSALTTLLDRWNSLLGSGDGLTPYGDDVLCGALVAGHACGDPAQPALARRVGGADIEHRTTATSAALLRLAAGGYCIPQVAAYLADRSAQRDSRSSRDRLLDVGESSGRGLLEGIDLVIGAAPGQAAA